MERDLGYRTDGVSISYFIILTANRHHDPLTSEPTRSQVETILYVISVWVNPVTPTVLTLPLRVTTQMDPTLYYPHTITIVRGIMALEAKRASIFLAVPENTGKGINYYTKTHIHTHTQSHSHLVRYMS